MCNNRQDWEYLKEAAHEMENYLLSDELYWPLPSLAPRAGGAALTRLTIGGLLLTSARVRACPVPDVRASEVEQALQSIDAVRDRWQAHWAEKVAKEFPNRLNLWANYLNDYFDDPGQFAHSYPSQVSWRAMLQLLAEAAGPRADRAALDALDRKLRLKFVPGSFVWDDDMAGGFPPEPYWFLYGLLPAK